MTGCTCAYPFSDWLLTYLLVCAGFAAVVLAIGSIVFLWHIMRGARP